MQNKEKKKQIDLCLSEELELTSSSISHESEEVVKAALIAALTVTAAVTAASAAAIATATSVGVTIANTTTAAINTTVSN